MMLKTAIFLVVCGVVLAVEKKEARSTSYPKEDTEDNSGPVKFPGASHSTYSPENNSLKPGSSQKVGEGYPAEQEIPSYLVQENKHISTNQGDERPTQVYPEDNFGDYDQQQLSGVNINLLFPSPSIGKRPFLQYPSESIGNTYIPKEGKLPGPTVGGRPILMPQGPQRPQYPEETDSSYDPEQKILPGHIGVAPRPPHYLGPQVQPPFRPMPQPQPGYGFGGRPNPGHWFVTRPQPGQGFIRPQPGHGNPQPGQGYGGNLQPGQGFGGNGHTGQGYGGKPRPGHGFDGNLHSGQGFEGNSHRLEDVIPGTPGKDYPTYSLLPTTSFHCKTDYPGFYADMEAGCQVWHYCQLDGRQDSFLCPNGTLFNQKYFVCDWWYNVDCPASQTFYPLNANLYKEAPKRHPPQPEYPRLLPPHNHHQHGIRYPLSGHGRPISAPRPSHLNPTVVLDAREVPEDENGYQAVKKSSS